MVKQAPQYDVDAFDEDPADHRIALYKSRQSSQTDIYPGNSVPLFLSDDDGEPDPSEFVTPLLKKRRASVSSRILAVPRKSMREAARPHDGRRLCPSKAF
jgi:hypothetical protein